MKQFLKLKYEKQENTDLKMPSGPRRLSRAGRGNTGDGGTSTRSVPVVPALEPPSLPKHIPFPVSSSDSNIFFDFVMALYALMGAGIQFLHLYRTVWWLPNSFTHTTMNFYLIDVNLVILIVMIFLRRLYYQIGCKLISKMYSNITQEDLSYLSRSILSVFYSAAIGFLATIVLGTRSKMDIVYLFYPIVVYMTMFGLRIRPFFEVSSWCSNGLHAIHACSSSPADIRKECELLKHNLLDRLRQIFFTAFINSYYGSFIPVCFSQSELVYEKYWNVEICILIFLGSLSFSFTHLMPLKYFDVLHRAVLHLGWWKRVDTDRNLALVTHEWREDVLWPGGALVKYNKAIWRAMGDCNSIVPGNRSLTLFYKVFILPSVPLCIVGILQGILVCYQLYCTFYSVYWYRIASLAILVCFSYLSMFKLLRDSIVSYSLYKQSEESDDEKHTQSVSPGVGATLSAGHRHKLHPPTNQNDAASADDFSLDNR